MILKSLARLRVWDKNLRLAAQEGNSERVQELLQRGVSIEVKSRNGYTPLMIAASNGHEKTVKTLLDAGADIEAKNQFGSTPLIIAVNNGRSETVQVLLNAKANIEEKNEFGSTPLMIAANNGRSETVQVLLNAKANIEARNQYGHTALMFAAMMNHNTTVQTLLDAKADIDATDHKGQTPLFFAANYRRRQTIKTLLNVGAKFADAGVSNEKREFFDGCWISHLNETRQRWNDLGINQELLAKTLAQYGDGVLSSEQSPKEMAVVVSQFQDGAFVLNKVEGLKKEGYNFSKVTSLPTAEQVADLEKNPFYDVKQDVEKEWRKQDPNLGLTVGDGETKTEISGDTLAVLLSNLKRPEIAVLSKTTKGFRGAMAPAATMVERRIAEQLFPGIIPPDVHREQQSSHVAALQAASSARGAEMAL